MISSGILWNVYVNFKGRFVMNPSDVSYTVYKSFVWLYEDTVQKYKHICYKQNTTWKRIYSPVQTGLYKHVLMKNITAEHTIIPFWNN